MDKIRERPWVRICAESVAIIASILLAFGIDAWYEGTNEQYRADDYERRIAAELTEIRGQMARLQRTVERAEEYATQAAAFFEGDRHSLSHERLVVVLYNVGRDSTAALDTSNYDDLVATGGFGIISDVDRRLAMQRAYGAISVVQRGRDPNRNEYLRGVRGWIPQHVIDQIRASCPGMGNEEWTCPEIDIDDQIVANVVRELSTSEAGLAFQLRHQGLDQLDRVIENALEEINVALEALN